MIKKENTAELEKEIMNKISSGEIKMKPRLYFIAGSVIGLFSLVGISFGLIFLFNLIIFLLRRHGPMGQWRIEMMLSSFSWWIPVVAIAGIILSVFLLKKYDFSYKKNFVLIIIAFIASIIVSAFLIDSLGLNEVWSKRGPMRNFYHKLESDVSEYNDLPGNRRWGENGLERPRYYYKK